MGSLLKALRLIDDTFVKVSDRLVYYVFFPALLFWKIGKPAQSAAIEWPFILAVLLAVFAVFALSLVFARGVRMPSDQIGSFSQGCYRFSTYVGMALVIVLMGEEGGRQFGVLLGFVIPFINVLAISSMIWYAGESSSPGLRTALLVKSTVTNPLIIACVAGILYSRWGWPLPGFLDRSLGLMSALALPLALISIGGSLTFAALGGHFRYSVAAALFKLAVLPVLGYLIVKAFQVDPLQLKIAMIYFALPTSPNNYILSALLHSDVELAGASIVLSVLLSIVPLSVAVLIFAG